ncbi:MAG: asparagine synthase (glutamine-hydrolyzing) [Phycisphaeraceae bacterium]|nr:asparagine synthase (glutamine-hydrolyzing) [Phycisphaeraceae bacterium]
MCGIFGLVSSSRQQGEIDALCQAGTKRLAHRGPDGSGYWSSPGVGLGHRRLSIIDISGGKQPMVSARAPLTIVFNGEIVNHGDLRKELERDGVRFASDHSDTEVILALYEREGVNCLKRLRGMFAFAIWDARDNSLFLARDHMGVKPLYFFEGDNEVGFSSEICALHDSGLVPFEANHKTFNEFLIFGVVAGQSTIHKSISELPAGHAAFFKNGVLKVHRYWYPAPEEFRADLTLDDAVDQLDSLISETMREWTISDVPVGALVSGGLDSTLVSYLSARDLDRLDMFTVFFPDHSTEIDERHLAALAAKLQIKNT